MARTILFLTDYGLQDEFVGVCHAVIARLAPDARVIDLAHGIAPGDVLAGAVALAGAVPYGPGDGVYLAVVDPGVGTGRRALALHAGSASLVGPDNGVLIPAARALGDVREAVSLDPERVALGPVFATFHGRDLFAPAAARLARGDALDQLGERVDPASLVVVEPEEPIVERGRLVTVVLGVDRFGNVRLSARPQHLDAARLAGPLSVVGEEHAPVRQARTFGDLAPGDYGLIEDSGGWLALVLRGASAAEGLGLRPYDRVILAAWGDALG